MLKIPYKKLYDDFKCYIVAEDFYYPVRDSINPEYEPYYLNFEWTLEKGHFDCFDEDGIPMRRYLNFDVQYNPTRIAAYALVHWNRFVSENNEESRELFLKQVNWYEKNAKEIQGCLCWCYEFDYGPSKAPWVSAMAQGESVSVLTRAYQLTKNNKYIDIIKRAVPVFDIPVNQGGIKSEFPDGSIVFEEWPRPDPQHIFNGNNYAIFGLYDYCKFIDPEDTEKQSLLNSAISAIKANLKGYDTGKWSLYHYPVERYINTATVYYHSLHVAQLEALYKITEDSIFLDYASKWKDYKSHLPNRLYAMTEKLKYRYFNPVKY